MTVVFTITVVVALHHVLEHNEMLPLVSRLDDALLIFGFQDAAVTATENDISFTSQFACTDAKVATFATLRALDVAGVKGDVTYLSLDYEEDDIHDLDCSAVAAEAVA